MPLLQSRTIAVNCIIRHLLRQPPLAHLHSTLQVAIIENHVDLIIIIATNLIDTLIMAVEDVLGAILPLLLLTRLSKTHTTPATPPTVLRLPHPPPQPPHRLTIHQVEAHISRGINIQRAAAALPSMTANVAILNSMTITRVSHHPHHHHQHLRQLQAAVPVQLSALAGLTSQDAKILAWTAIHLHIAVVVVVVVILGTLVLIQGIPDPLEMDVLPTHLLARLDLWFSSFCIMFDDKALQVLCERNLLINFVKRRSISWHISCHLILHLCHRCNLHFRNKKISDGGREASRECLAGLRVEIYCYG